MHMLVQICAFSTFPLCTDLCIMLCMTTLKVIREEPLADTLKGRLLQLRELSGLTQDEWARIADVSRRTVSKWESPHEPDEPSLEQIRRFAAFCHIPPRAVVDPPAEVDEVVVSLCAPRESNPEPADSVQLSFALCAA